MGPKYDTKSKSREQQRELMTGLQTLIVGDVPVKEQLNPNPNPARRTPKYYFTNSMFADISEKFLDIVAEHLTAKSFTLHMLL